MFLRRLWPQIFLRAGRLTQSTQLSPLNQILIINSEKPYLLNLLDQSIKSHLLAKFHGPDTPNMFTKLKIYQTKCTKPNIPNQIY